MRRTALIVTATTLAALALAGCSYSNQQSASPAASTPAPVTAPTTTPAEKPATSSATKPAATGKASSAAGPEVAKSGVVHTPKAGSNELTALVASARSKLGVNSKIDVVALKSDGAWAAGILHPLDSTKYVYLAWRNEVDGGWTAIWSAPSGTGAKKAILAKDSRFPAAVIGAIPWATVPAPATPKPTTSQAVTAVKSILAKESPDIQIASVENVKMAKDAKGQWWVSAVAVPVNNPDAAYDSVVLYIYRDGTTWKLANMGTEIDPADLPAEVRTAIAQ